MKTTESVSENTHSVRENTKPVSENTHSVSENTHSLLSEAGHMTAVYLSGAGHVMGACFSS